MKRSVKPVSEQPRLTMVRWLLLALVRNGDELAVMLVGYSVETGTPRIASPLITVNGRDRLVTTSYGRIYELVGPSGIEPLATSAFLAKAACSQCGVRNVTQRFCEQADLCWKETLH